MMNSDRTRTKKDDELDRAAAAARAAVISNTCGENRGREGWRMTQTSAQPQLWGVSRPN